MRLKKEDAIEIGRRTEAISNHTLILQALQTELQIFLTKKVEEYGLDPKKNYTFDPKTSKIKEKKPQAKKA